MKLLAPIMMIGFVGFAASEVTIGKKPNLLQLAVSLNLTKFVEEIKKVGIDRIINHEGKFTVFAPNNEAFAHEKCYPSEASLKDKLRFHIAWGELKAGNIKNDQTLRTLLPKRTIRMNVYNNKQVVTANGRKIVSTDHEAHNGVIHVISDVMSSVYDREGSVVSELEDCCPHHSVLLQLVRKAGLYSFLDRRGPVTFFPPDNGAFAKLHPDYINHLVKNETALRMVLLTHVVPGTLYSPGLKNGDVIKTMSGVKLCVGVKPGEVQIGTAKVQLMDVTAGNGAIHTLDTVQFPNQPSNLDACNAETTEKAPEPLAAASATFETNEGLRQEPTFLEVVLDRSFRRAVRRWKSLVRELETKTLMSEMNEDPSLTHFVTLILDAGLENLFKQTHYPWTVFAPTNSALESVFAQGNPKLAMAKVVLGHVLPGNLQYDELRSSTGSIFTANGDELKRQITEEGQVMLNGVPVRKAGDKKPTAVNGALLKVDEVLI